MKNILIIGTGILFALVFFSCKENSLEKQRQAEMKKLGEYMRANHSGVDPKPSGLFYFPIDEGTGDSIRIDDRVEIFYDLFTLDTTLIRSTGNYEPLAVVVLPPTQLSSSAQSISTVRALHEALTYMKKGSSARLIFDSSLGFGQSSTSGIAGFTPLIMDVRVYKVHPARTPEQEE